LEVRFCQRDPAGPKRFLYVGGEKGGFHLRKGHDTCHLLEMGEGRDAAIVGKKKTYGGGRGINILHQEREGRVKGEEGSRSGGRWQWGVLGEDKG